MPNCIIGRFGAHTAVWGGIVALCGFLASVVHSQTPEFAPRAVIPRAFPAIKNPPAISAAEANRVLGEGELVLGVTVGDSSRAYPINMLTGPQREIINDTLGGRAIAATW